MAPRTSKDGRTIALPSSVMNARRLSWLNRMRHHRFEDRTASYPKSRIAVRRSVTCFAVPMETDGKVGLCEGFRMPAALEPCPKLSGRRTKTSKGRNRGMDALWAVRRAQLWRFERGACRVHGSARGKAACLQDVKRSSGAS